MSTTSKITMGATAYDLRDADAQEQLTQLKSDLSVFEENTFSIIPPTDYGALIKAEDCAASKAGVLTYADTENGILITKSARENVGLYVYFNDIPTASQAKPVTYDFTITVDSTTGIDAVYFYDGSTQVGSYSGGTITKDGNTYSFSYTYQNQSKLRWQIGLLYSFQSTKTITSVTGVVQNAETEYKIVPSTIKWYLDDIYGANFDAPKNGLKVNKVYTSLWSQGACSVGDYYIGFDASADDHSTSGNMYIGRFSEMPTRVTAHHNLGHCASADYNATTDTMIVGNGTTDTTIPPTIYLVKNALSIAENKTDIAYDDANVVVIDLTGMHGNGGCVACFGENHYIVYVVTTDNATPFAKNSKKHIYRCVMGLGANNMVASYPTESFGTFISDCAVTEYNGTLRVLNEFEIDFSGELQGLKYGDGYLILPMDAYKNNVLTAYLAFVKLADEAVIDKVYWIPVVQASSGSLVRTECEDVIFHDSAGYVVTTTTDGSTTIYRTHVFRA